MHQGQAEIDEKRREIEVIKDRSKATIADKERASVFYRLNKHRLHGSASQASVWKML